MQCMRVNNSIDGTFPLHDPDPIERKNLAQLIDIVQKNKCDLGIALDGDGDRICLIDNRGNIVSNDHLFMIFAREVLEKYPQSKVIANIKMSMKAHDFVNKLGGQVIICATGHSLIKKKMLEEKAKFAGELSGHFFFSEIGFDEVVENAKVLAQALQKYGLNIVTGDTDSHMVLIDLRSQKLNGKDVVDSLERAGIICNKNSIPFDTEKPTKYSFRKAI